jgi:uncharacterized protein YgiM (DUF1202 family)
MPKKRGKKAPYLLISTLAVYICALMSGMVPANVNAGQSSDDVLVQDEVLLPVGQIAEPAALNIDITPNVGSDLLPEEMPDDEYTAEPEETELSAYVNGSSVRLRSQSNTSSDILHVFSRNTAVTVTGTEDDWYMVTYKGLEGYVLSDFITIGVLPAAAPAVSKTSASNVSAESAALIVIPEPQPEITSSDPLPALENDSEEAYVNASSVRLRSESNTASNTLRTLRRYTAVTVIGVENDYWYKAEVEGQTGYIFGDYVTFGKAPEPTIELLDWWNGGKSLMRTGTIGTLTDVATGRSFDIRVMSSGNHADSEPLTAADTATLKSIRGGSYSWTPRAALLTVGDRVIAVSYNGMPHGGSSISGNNFSGHFCIHFLNSRNHFNNRVAPEHQNRVSAAFNSR